MKKVIEFIKKSKLSFGIMVGIMLGMFLQGSSFLKSISEGSEISQGDVYFGAIFGGIVVGGIAMLAEKMISEK